MTEQSVAEFIWKPETVHFYLKDKTKSSQAENPDPLLSEHISVSRKGHRLGLLWAIQTCRRKDYSMYDHEGLIIEEKNPAYAIEVAPLDNIQFADYRWVEVNSTGNKKDNTFVRTKEYEFKQLQPYEGTIDAVLKFGTVSYEGDCGPSPIFESFFSQGRLVAGWHHLSSDRQEKALTTNHDLVKILDSFGDKPHPSAEQVRGYLKHSNLPKDLLVRYEGFFSR